MLMGTGYLASLGKVEPIDVSTWERHWLDSRTATFFHGPTWAQIWEKYSQGGRRVVRHEPRAALLRLADGFEAVLPAMITGTFPRFIKGRWVSSAAGTYGGWFSRAVPTDEQARALWRITLARRAPQTVRLNPFDSVQVSSVVAGPEAPFAWSAPLQRARQDWTHVVDVRKEPDELWRGFRKGHRSAVTKARREGVTTRLAETTADWRAYYAMYEAALERWGDRASSKYHWDLFQAMVDIGSTNIRLWLAEHQGTIVAGALCLYSTEHISYWHGASRRDLQELRAVNLLLFDIISDAHERGYRWFDFNPSGGHKDVAAFKRGFRPETLCCPVLVTDRPWLAFARAGKRTLSALRR